MQTLTSAARAIGAMTPDQHFGKVAAVRGSLIEVEGLLGSARIGSQVSIATPEGVVEAEVTGLDRDVAHCLPFSDPRGVASGAIATLAMGQSVLRPATGWLGRVVDGLGRPADGKGPLAIGQEARLIKGDPPAAVTRNRVGARVQTGVRALDIFAPLCKGQRLGLFAGSGVGKSTLMSMLTRWTECDVAVIGLIGERGREVQEFIEDNLGPEGLARSVVVVATSDAPALMRRQAAWTTMAIAEHFRDEGKDVLCMMDSVTRFAMAQREIGLANGEPPATKGYTPTVFAELPRLLERAGPGGPGQGSITGLFSVLVDGDDHDEPIADAVRGILDGHIVLSRKIGERGRFPAVDLLKSVSRMLPECHSDRENQIRTTAAALLSTYSDMEELVRLGAYKDGSDPAVDRAIRIAPAIEDLLKQSKKDPGDTEQDFAQLGSLIEVPE